ncbi:hypothetical protein M5K25_009416 [Dendrobium thyrsiflorum]|uniref:porphobilinogen synthase n=1 Tax=Dendrobium thyrsiflorum TaxID=117978 RepID=A0ABD0VCD6_DENTH
MINPGSSKPTQKTHTNLTHLVDYIPLSVALDPYSSDGHDGIVREDGVIMNDETVHQM